MLRHSTCSNRYPYINDHVQDETSPRPRWFWSTIGKSGSDYLKIINVREPYSYNIEIWLDLFCNLFPERKNRLVMRSFQKMRFTITFWVNSVVKFWLQFGYKVTAILCLHKLLHVYSPTLYLTTKSKYTSVAQNSVSSDAVNLDAPFCWLQTEERKDLSRDF